MRATTRHRPPLALPGAGELKHGRALSPALGTVGGQGGAGPAKGAANAMPLRVTLSDSQITAACGDSGKIFRLLTAAPAECYIRDFPGCNVHDEGAPL